MRLTKHAREHIIGRTKLASEDIVELISAGAFVSLGEVDGYEYLLFYSYLDRKARIAIVAEQRQILISIWKTRFFLPDGIREPDKNRQRAAKEAYEQFALQHGKTTAEPASNSQSTDRTQIEVFTDSKLIYQEEGPAIPAASRDDKHQVLAFLRPNLRRLVDIVESTDNAKNRVQYKIWVLALNKIRPPLCYSLSQRNAKRATFQTHHSAPI